MKNNGINIEINAIDRFIEKVWKLLGLDIVVSFLEAKEDRIKRISEVRTNSELKMKEAIINNPSLSLEQKFQLNAMVGVNYKKFLRQMEVLEIAVDNMDEDCSEDNVEEDWLLDFFDKVSNINNDDIKKVWGKLLASAASDKNICSKSLLSALFMMSTDEMKDFQNLTRFCFSEFKRGKDSYKISAYPIIYFAKNVKNYEMSGVTRLRLNKLQSLGLIDVDYKKEFVFSKKSMRLIYNNKLIELSDKDKIRIGNVIFTYDGFLLYQMIEKMHNNSILDFNIDIWKKREYKVEISR